MYIKTGNITCALINFKSLIQDIPSYILCSALASYIQNIKEIYSRLFNGNSAQARLRGRIQLKQNCMYRFHNFKTDLILNSFYISKILEFISKEVALKFVFRIEFQLKNIPKHLPLQWQL